MIETQLQKSPYVPVFELTRGGIPESVHFGALAIVNSRGELVASYGDPGAVTFLRSSAKPFQAMPFLESGGQEAYGLTLKEIALICASHAGTDEHVETLKGIQAKTGVGEGNLLCGTHPLSHPATIEAMRARGELVSPNRHNCSGKHTGMLAFTRLMNIPIEESTVAPAYTDPSHPIQKEIFRVFSEMCDLNPAQVVIGIDGCSVPTFGVPLRNAALAYARLCDPWELESHRADICRTISQAMTSNPYMVGGPDSFDTLLMEISQGRIVCKGGAEGYQALGLLPGASGAGSPGVGITVKISDEDLGSHSNAPFGHARQAVTLEVLRQLGALSSKELDQMYKFGPDLKLTNWRKLEVGQGRPVFKLNHAS